MSNKKNPGCGFYSKTAYFLQQANGMKKKKKRESEWVGEPTDKKEIDKSTK